MTTASDLLTSFGINGVASVVIIGLFSILKNQPLNARVYFAKWQLKGEKVGPTGSLPAGTGIRRYINLDAKSYIHVMDWIKDCLRMPEAELIDHAGLDSAVFLRLILLGLKLFVPLTVVGFVVLVPLNVTDKQLSNDLKDKALTYDALDTITISNISTASRRLWAHLVAAYVYTIWACWLLFREYRNIVALRFTFLALQIARPDQFTILCRCIPEDPDEPIATHVDHFFRVNHPDHYLLSQVVYNANDLAKLVKRRAKLQNKITYLQGVMDKKLKPARPTVKTGYWGLWGKKVDQINYYDDEIAKLTDQITAERMRVLTEDKAVMPAAFVSFETRWGAAVCSQTVQSRDLSKWLTEWAPEPRDVYWANLPIPYHRLNSRRLGMLILTIVLVIFFFFPVTFVQGFANLQQLERNLPFLKPIVELDVLKSAIQGFLPGLILKIFLLALPYVLNIMTRFEGHVSYSRIDKYAAAKYFGFMVVNVFLGNVLVGSAFEQLKEFIDRPTQIPKTLAQAVPMKATFFITYIMVDGWTGLAVTLMRLIPLLLFHFRSALMVRTTRDLERATPVGTIELNTALPQLGLYFILGLVYAVISPFILPFIVVSLGASYVVNRNQILNCYEAKYESAAAFWPHMFGYIIIGLLLKHLTLIGLMALKEATSSTPFLLPLPICTLIFYLYCKNRFEEAFHSYALEEAKAKDTIERAREPDLDVRAFLENAYIHPTLRSVVAGNDLAGDESDDDGADELMNRNLPPKNGPKTLLSRGASGENQGDSPTKSPSKTPTKPLSRGGSQDVSNISKRSENSTSREKLEGAEVVDIKPLDDLGAQRESISDAESLNSQTMLLHGRPKSIV
ncbi:calcium permeable stress-gated cation channel [Marchantia polymorpha subsp. ruderalis]|uniref:ERD4-related membrane protein n=2 Tax=Marchantia polymorpha TaxID=3197 RepID=A0AAF6BW37_MARPO|nr:hypothetical protein MARPO_0062s0077 [Marchantia polymorpha]BBN16221.1 hypothetical protein Mp_7g04480 [Marchantia polymorpha subsp. ruderalis]|eukprot:PTQ36660.1 hypothetical protein MARPO_0062s0077 [Marchantia polymorpha]